MERHCDACGSAYQARSPRSKFCTPACKMRAHRKSKAPAKAPAIPRAVKPPKLADALENYEREFAELANLLRLGDIEAATRLELESVGRTNTSVGQRALLLARLLDHPPFGTYSSVAGWSREHAAAMATALADSAAPRLSIADEIKARRDAKRGA